MLFKGNQYEHLIALPEAADGLAKHRSHRPSLPPPENGEMVYPYGKQQA